MKVLIAFVTVGCAIVVYFLYPRSAEVQPDRSAPAPASVRVDIPEVSNGPGPLPLATTGALASSPIDRNDAAIAAALEKLKVRRRFFLSDEVLNALKGQETLVLDACVNATNLNYKIALINALSFIGGEPTVEQLKADLFGEPLKLSAKDAFDFYASMLLTLGTLSENSDSAFHVITNGIRLAYTKEIRAFQNEDPLFFGRMTDSCINAVGHSGRPEVESILGQLKAFPPGPVVDPDTGRSRGFSGSSIVSAAFYDSLLRTHGRDYVRTNTFANPRTWRDTAFFEWSKTPEGIEWREWSRKTR